MPDEQRKLRKASGTYYRGLDEWEVNLPIAEALQAVLERNGVLVDLLPATVPPGYHADAFIAIHVDGISGAQAATKRGWKVGTPWRASPAAEMLASLVGAAYSEQLAMPEDPHGASIDMRGYYALAPYRYRYAVDPSTPSIVFEAGFMTHPADRPWLLDKPGTVAAAIADGILAYLAQRPAAGSSDLQPQPLPAVQPKTSATPMRNRASMKGSVIKTLTPASELVTIGAVDGWYYVTTRDNWDIGWVAVDDVVVLPDESLLAMPAE